MSIFISSGEASGDHYTALLAKHLRMHGYNGDIWGMGGIESRNAGIRTEWNGDRLQLLGITEVFYAIPSIFSLLKEMTQRIMDNSPEAVVVCDSPDFHMRLASRLRKAGYNGRIFYISPPSVWAWRSSRVKRLKSDFDECLPLFKFEHEYLAELGCKSYWHGHPLVEEFEAEKEAEMPKTFDRKRMVTFLPGSRASEIKALMPVMKESAEIISAKGWQPVFSVAPGLNPVARAALIEELKQKKFLFYEGSGHNLLKWARCAVAASGTVTVESLILNCYMVVTYRINAFSALIARLFIKTPFFTMANILAGCEMFPELLQDNATPQNITDKLLMWLDSENDLHWKTEEIMKQARTKFGEKGVYDFWCDRILGGAHA